MTDTLDGGCAAAGCATACARSRCLCIAVTAGTASARPVPASRKRTIQADRVEVLTGEPRPYAMPTDSGKPHTVFRVPTAAPRCGANTAG